MSQDTEWTVSRDSSKPTGSHSVTNFPSGSANSPYAYQGQQPEASQPSTSKYAKAGSKVAKWKPSLSLFLIRNKPPGVAKQECQRGKPGKGHGKAWTKTIEIYTYDDSMYAIRKTLNLPITLSEKTASVNCVAKLCP